MVLGFKRDDDDIPSLIAKKNYPRAIAVIKEKLKTNRNDPRLRNQLADILVSAGKEMEAVNILLVVADDYAKEGFAAKAISVLKKVQKIDPGRREVESRLAGLIEEKQKQATVDLPQVSAPSFELGMEEIGFDAGGPVSVPAPAGPELGMDLGAVSAPAPPPPPRPKPAPPPPKPPPPKPAPPPPKPPPPPPPPRPAPPPQEAAPAPVEDMDLAGFEGLDQGAADEGLQLDSAPFELEAESTVEPEPAVEPAVEPEPMLEPTLEPEPASAEPEFDLNGGGGSEFDLDAGAEGEFDLDGGGAAEASIEPEPEPEPEPAGDLMSSTDFADELLSAIDDAFSGLTLGGDEGEAAPAAAEDPGAGAQIVVSPLFKDFSVDEMVAVIQGLKLLTFDRGQVIIRQGDPGNSLYMLTSGSVKAFIKKAGKQVPVGEMEEGAFFGEVSILTGKPRTASVVALTACELLELDRPTLDGIVKTHPHVREVLREFASQRTN